MVSSVEQANLPVFLQKFHNTRIKPLDLIEAPIGWAVDGNKFQELGVLYKIKGIAIPLMVQQGTSPSFRNARMEFGNMRTLYGNDAFMLLVRDDETEWGWSARPVLPVYFTVNPESLIADAMREINLGNNTVGEGMRVAYLALTGYQDTK